MKKQKLNNKGITLLALIITIVILLILAIVTIGAIKDSSIITHSKYAKDEYTKAQEEEQIQLALIEWQLQKDTGNKTFKAVISSALENDAKLKGEENGPLTVTLKKTGHAYEVSADGTIKEIDSTDSNDNTEIAKLKKYIFGTDLSGKNVADILDEDGCEFKNDPNTISNASEEIKYLSSALKMVNDIGTVYDYYFSYNTKIYKFSCVATMDADGEENDTRKTLPDYGITEIEVEGEYIGKKVWYDNKKWTILYNDDTNGLQMICDETYLYSGDDFYLGTKDSSITNWDSLTETADLDKNRSLSDLEKAIYSYNNAITTLNTACESVVTKNDNIIDIRCVGSNPTSTDSENGTLYTSENLKNWSESSGEKVDSKGKSKDFNYVTDFERMVALGISKVNGKVSSYYWLASRLICDTTSSVNFFVRSVAPEGGIFDLVPMWVATKDGAFQPEGLETKGLRPVITLSSFDCLTIDASYGTDYILK